MDTREYLNQIQRYSKIIDNKLEEIEYHKSLATNIGSSSYGMERVQTSVRQDKMADAVSKLVDLQNELADEVIKYTSKRREVIEAIESVKEPQYCELLFKRYVECKKLSVIADEMEYNDEYIKQLHSKALKRIKEMKGFES